MSSEPPDATTAARNAGQPPAGGAAPEPSRASADAFFADFLSVVEDEPDARAFDLGRRGPAPPARSVPPRGVMFAGDSVAPRVLPGSSAEEHVHEPAPNPTASAASGRPDESVTIGGWFAQLARAGAPPEPRPPDPAPAPPPAPSTPSGTTSSLGRVFDEFASDPGMWDALRPGLDLPRFTASPDNEMAPILPGASLSTQAEELARRLRAAPDAPSDAEGAPPLGGFFDELDPAAEDFDVRDEGRRQRRLYREIIQQARSIEVGSERHLGRAAAPHPPHADASLGVEDAWKAARSAMLPTTLEATVDEEVEAESGPSAAASPDAPLPPDASQLLNLLREIVALADRLGVPVRDLLGAMRLELDTLAASATAGTTAPECPADSAPVR